MNIMDYSLMIGVHDIIRGNKENVRNSTLQSFQVTNKGTIVYNSTPVYFVLHHITELY